MIKIGNKDLKNIMIGSTQVKKVMVQGSQIWPTSVTPPQPPEPPEPPQPVMPNGVLEIKATVDSIMHFDKISSSQVIRRWNEGWIDISEGEVIEIPEGSSLYLAGTLSGHNSTTDFTQLPLVGSVSLVGELKSLYKYDFFKNDIDSAGVAFDYASYGLFANSPAVMDCKSLDLTGISSAKKDVPSYGFYSTFRGCNFSSYPDMKSGLGGSNNRPFYEMFRDAKSTSEESFEISFTSTSGNCVEGMFTGADFKEVTVNLNSNAEQSAFYSMFKDSKVKVLRFNTNGNNFFNYACDGMLSGCTSLTDIYIDVEPSQIQARYCFSAWALNVSDSGTIHLRKDISLEELQTIDGLIPRYWNVVQDI